MEYKTTNLVNILLQDGGKSLSSILTPVEPIPKAIRILKYDFDFIAKYDYYSISNNVWIKRNPQIYLMPLEKDNESLKNQT